MTNNLPDNVLSAMVRTRTRVTVMARYEGTTDVPEHANLAADTTLKPDGKHNRLNTRKELKIYDPQLYELINQYFDDFKRNPSKHAYQNKFKIKR